MPRLFSICTLFLALPCLAQQPDNPTERVIRLQVQPMPAKKPELRYQLLPELRDMNPGNPVQGFMKCFFEQQNLFHRKEGVEQREKWDTMALKDLPVKELRGYGGVAVAQANYAARLDTSDWQVLLKMKNEGVFLLLPEVQEMRSLASVLKCRFRGEIADGRFDEALVIAQTMFALARVLGEHPTMIGDLAGIAVASLAIDPLEEMLQQPSCPNLFWAFTDLPSPFIDFRKGLQGERIMLMNWLDKLDANAPMKEEQLQSILTHNHFPALLDMSLMKGKTKKGFEWLLDLNQASPPE